MADPLNSLPMMFFDSPYDAIRWDTLRGGDQVEIGILVDAPTDVIDFKVRGDALKIDTLPADSKDEHKAFNFTTTEEAP